MCEMRWVFPPLVEIGADFTHTKAQLPLSLLLCLPTCSHNFPLYYSPALLFPAPLYSVSSYGLIPPRPHSFYHGSLFY